MITSREDIQAASREEIVEFLESWGTACYDEESTSLLREAALDCWDTERGEYGPA